MAHQIFFSRNGFVKVFFSKNYFSNKKAEIEKFKQKTRRTGHNQILKILDGKNIQRFLDTTNIRYKIANTKKSQGVTQFEIFPKQNNPNTQRA